MNGNCTDVSKLYIVPQSSAFTSSVDSCRIGQETGISEVLLNHVALRVSCLVVLKDDAAPSGLMKGSEL